MKKRSKIAFGIFLLFYITFGFYITQNQENIIYQPGSQDFENCQAFLNAEKVMYQGTRMYVEKGSKGTVVLYHGNAGSACDRALYAEQFLKAGYGYIIPEYAGYSNDSRIPTHALVKQDVENVLEYMREQILGNIVVIGESIGTGVASYHASLQAPDKLLLISPFASLADVAQRKFWFYPAFLMVDNAFDNIELLSKYKGPITFIHGDSDKIISQKSGLKLYNSLQSEDKKYFSIKGYGHNDLFTSIETYEIIQSFLVESTNF